MLKALFGDHSSGGLLFVETAIDVSFGVSFDLRVEPALKTCYYFTLKELCVLLFYLCDTYRSSSFPPDHMKGGSLGWLPPDQRQTSEASSLLIKGQRE